jgi:L-cystine uptake protein TcyP (sodium:dicarboxylate symporter family)
MITALIWIVAIYLAVGLAFVILAALLAWSGGEPVTWSGVAAGLFLWPRFAWAIFGPH